MKTRIIHTKIWTDTYFSELNTTERLLFLYLLTNEIVGMTGMYELNDRKIMFDTGLNKKQLDDIKTKFVEDNKFYFIDGWVKILNYEKYQSYKGEKNSKAYEKEMKCVPESLKVYSIDTVSEIDDTVSAKADTAINHKSKTVNHKSLQGECEGGDSLIQLDMQSEPEQPVEAGGTGTYHSPEDIGELEFRRVAEQYNVPESFVRSKYDDMVNWRDEDPTASNRRKKKNWLATLKNWVKRDALQVRSDHARQKQQYAVTSV